jgi:hypothetical protein
MGGSLSHGESNDLRHVERHMASHSGELTLDPQGTAPLHAISVPFRAAECRVHQMKCDPVNNDVTRFREDIHESASRTGKR